MEKTGNNQTLAVSVIPIKCCVQNYAWGQKGSKSLVAKFLKKHDPKFVVDETSPYAELWMGTHSGGESLVTGIGDSYENKRLSQLLLDLPEFVGTMQLLQAHGYQLPYLFKMLSIDTPLSIQVHPNLEQADRLHRQDPQHYPDRNHKPELAIAINDFETLCGFRTHDEIRQLLHELVEVRTQLIGNQLWNQYWIASGEEEQRNLLRNIVLALLNAPTETVEQQLTQTRSKFEHELDHDLNKSSNKISNQLKNLFLKIHRHYPTDVGCFFVFFLNYLKLSAGQSIHIEAGEAHCYISGDCIECMACGDNTIRAGLTPKFKDVQALSECLNFEPKSVDQVQLIPRQVDDCTNEYRPPGCAEFAVDVITVALEERNEYRLPAKESGSILLVLSGEAIINCNRIRPGYVCFVPAMTSLKLTFIRPELVIYRAYCPS